MKNSAQNANDFQFTSKELEKMESIFRWSKVGFRMTEEEELVIEKILYKIRRLKSQ